MFRSKWSRLKIQDCLLFSVAMLGLVIVAGCGKKQPAESQKELVLLCGSSFIQPAEKLSSLFTTQTGVKIVTTSGSSEDLLPLIKTGRKGDVFITHDPYLDYVLKAQALGEHIEAGFVAPVLAVQKGNPHGIKTIEDLARPGLKIALTDPQYSTCGEMVFALLEKKGIKEAVMKNVENRLTKGHSTLGTFLKTKTVDAVIIWNGVAHTFRDDLEVVPTPYEYDKDVRVHIIGLSYSKQPELLNKFFEFAKNKGPEIFAEYGYIKEYAGEVQ